MSILEKVYSNFVIKLNFNDVLSDFMKVKLTEVSKFFYNKRQYLIFNEKYLCCKNEIDSWYFQKLRNVKIHEMFQLPNNLRKLEICCKFNESIEKDFFSSSLIKLKVTEDFYNKYKNYIPTHFKIKFTNDVFCLCGFEMLRKRLYQKSQEKDIKKLTWFEYFGIFYFIKI